MHYAIVTIGVQGISYAGNMKGFEHKDDFHWQKISVPQLRMKRIVVSSSVTKPMEYVWYEVMGKKHTLEIIDFEHL